MRKTIWIDLLNPSHPLFFSPLVNTLSDEYKIFITIRDRAETVKLAKLLGLDGVVIGRDYEGKTKKAMALALRTLSLVRHSKKYHFSIGLENPGTVLVSKLKNKKSILFLDNDLKYKVKSSLIQKVEGKIKTHTDYLIIPKACYETLFPHFKRAEIYTFDGYKEDIYIADYTPNPDFLRKIPFKDYIVIRPEALASLYVEKKESIVGELISLFSKENINIILLPRDRSDFIKYRTNERVYILPSPLNGLDLIYHASAVLTGSGTMAREAAIMGRKAVSFFPEKELLSVDRELISSGLMIHSREPKEITEYVISQPKKRKNLEDIKMRSEKAKDKVIRIINGIMNEV